MERSRPTMLDFQYLCIFLKHFMQFSFSTLYLDVEPKIGGKPPKWIKMDGLFHGKFYYSMDDLGGFPIFLEPPISQSFLLFSNIFISPQVVSGFIVGATIQPKPEDHSSNVM